METKVMSGTWKRNDDNAHRQSFPSSSTSISASSLLGQSAAWKWTATSIITAEAKCWSTGTFTEFNKGQGSQWKLLSNRKNNFYRLHFCALKSCIFSKWSYRDPHFISTHTVFEASERATGLVISRNLETKCRHDFFASSGNDFIQGTLDTMHLVQQIIATVSPDLSHTCAYITS